MNDKVLLDSIMIGAISSIILGITLMFTTLSYHAIVYSSLCMFLIMTFIMLLRKIISE